MNIISKDFQYLTECIDITLKNIDLHILQYLPISIRNIHISNCSWISKYSNCLRYCEIITIENVNNITKHDLNLFTNCKNLQIKNCKFLE